MSDETTKKDNEIKHQYNRFRNSIKSLFGSILRLEGTDVLGTIESIKKDMVFRGATAWILMFSILIASIGLNANSTAVIIGAMLISPLMGPIVAMGLSIGTNDFDLLKRALKNFLIAMTISLITSTLYFLLTPLKETTSELLSRTSPTILDVFIALFGGFAGIIAGSRRERSNVIPGVAIATALMPPLCTAGYGLATWQLNFFFGALYLFFINSVFISLATVTTVKLMKFPQKKFLDETQARKIRMIMTAFIVVVILPSLIIFLKVIKESRFNTNAEKFVHQEVKVSGSQLLNSTYEFNDTLAFINLYFIGKPVNDSAIMSWTLRLPEYNLVSNQKFFNKFFLPDTTVIRVYQTGTAQGITEQDIEKMNQSLQQEIRVGVLEDIYKKNEEIINEKDQQIQKLQTELNSLKKNEIPVSQLFKELNVQYPRIISFSYGQNIKIVNDSTIDTIPTFVLTWQKGTSNYYKRQKLPTLSEWLKVRFGLDTLIIVEE